MTDAQIIEFAQHGVYDGKTGDLIALCKSEKNAKLLAKILAGLDPVLDSYRVKPITKPHELIEGGGTSITYKMTETELS